MVEAQVDEIKKRLPSSSLMECIHHAASHYYDGRQLLQNGQGNPSSSHKPASRDSYGMAMACEGNALVAMAVFIEELAVWEAGARTQSVEPVEGATEPDLVDTEKERQAWRRLQELRQESVSTIKQNLRRTKRQKAKLALHSPEVTVKRKKAAEPLKDTVLWPLGHA
jgi:hypothetical protein